jgi:hypothetical protein
MDELDNKNGDKLEIYHRDINELIFAEYNPRKISEKAKGELIQSINTFGMVEPILVNMHPNRLNIIIGGHQRVKVAKEVFSDRFKTIPCVYAYIADIETEKELNLRLNKNVGEWDYMKLLASFNVNLLKNVGFTDDELKFTPEEESELDKAAEEYTNDNVPYPIVPKFTEKYEAVIIFCETEMEMAWLRNILQLGPAKDYKTKKIAPNYVMTCKNFQDIWTANTSNENKESFETATDKDAQPGKIEVIIEDENDENNKDKE